MTTTELQRRLQEHDYQLRIENQALEAWCRRLAIDYYDLLEELVDLLQRVERREAINVKQN